MNKFFAKIAGITAGLALVASAGVALANHAEVKGVKADYTDVYTLDATDSSVQTTNNSYGKTGTVTVDGIEWTFTGNGKINPWRLGGKTAQSGDQPFYTNTAFASGVDKIVVEFGSISGVTANSFQMSVHSSAADAASGSNAVESHTGLSIGANVTAEITLDAQQTGKFFRFVPNLTISATSNKYLQLKTVKFQSAGDEPAGDTYKVTYDANGGSGTMSDEKEYESGDTVTVLANSFTAPSFQEFVSFNTKKDGSGTSYAPGATFEISKNTTLYAIWDFEDVELVNGDYEATLEYVNPIPSSIDVVASGSSTPVALLSLNCSDVSYDTTHSEYKISANGYVEIVNHSNAIIKTVSFEVYNFDNIDVFVDGSETAMHSGDGSNIGDHTKIELAVEAESTVKIVGNGGSKGTYTQNFYGFEVALKVGADVTHVTGVTLDHESGNVYLGKTRTLSATVSPVTADDKTVVWSSSDESVATVADGVVTPVAAGSAIITVTTNDGGFTASFAATVKTLSYGTAESPLSPEEAREVLEINGSAISDEKLFVKGVVYSSTYNSTNSNYTIWLKNSDGSVNQYFELFKTTVEGEYTAKDALKNMMVVATGYGQIYSNTTYELTNSGSDYPSVVSLAHTAASFAYAVTSDTKSQCDAFVDGVSDYGEYKSALETIWESLNDKFDMITDSAEVELLINADADEKGSAIEQAMARYDFLCVKYGLDQFITGRSIATRYVPTVTITTDTNSAIAVVAIVAIASISAIAVVLVIKRRRALEK